MKTARKAERPRSSGKMFVSRADAVFLMIASSAAAVLTTVLSVGVIAGYFTGPATLVLPIALNQRTVSGLELESSGHFVSLEATIPDLPDGPATLLAWGVTLNQVGMLAILALVFLLAYRLRSATLFTPGSVWIVGVCGAALALTGTVGQLLDGWARSRLADMIAANGRAPGESFGFSVELNIAPLMTGLVLMLVAGVFQYGRRLQRDTEGLV